ncbi:ParB family chromosome partitioning protein [Rhizobium sp. BK529]|uniref:ParB/RepB/Spo0J family partition protein n=1 Tax=Rhizobium sp. BK529 TaxID=2586983 RepID=UPI00161BFE90|nr:ParB/RepB/Spo0J family partition protein [Rhizobium sp. BK529]MBB3595125.1 ParB family chromosome partitioning protein [Rhizobium sp. BK529]
MTEKTEKITLATACDIPFNKLVLSQANVRKIKAGVSIEELAQDIARRGLLTSLSVRPELDDDGKETGMYRIPAGGRRYRALALLVSQKRLSKTAGIPCVISRGERPEAEDSLAENVHRESLHPLDQFRAFETLRGQGMDEEEIAARFFVPVATVRQRLRLASVSPKLLDLYAEDGITLEQLMAFSISKDHARQEQVWEAIARSYSREPYYIRRLLTETAVRATDRRSVYVGIDVYEAAGGVVMRDLFDEDRGGWLQDPALLDQLVLEQLKSDAAAIQDEEGWKWVEAAFDFPYGHTTGLRRVFGQQAEWSEEDLARHDALQAEYDRLDAEYASASDYSEETEQRLEELGTELDRLNDRPYVYDPEDLARSGVFVSLEANGTLRIERGYVRPEDEPQVEMTCAVEQESDTVSEVVASCDEPRVGDDDEETLKPLADRLVLDLTAARTVALRNALAKDPVIAFVAVLHAFVLKTFYLYGADTCLELTLQSARFSETPGLADTIAAKEIAERQEAWGQDLPKDPTSLFAFLVALDDVSRHALFAHCASLSVNAVIEPWNRRPRAIAHADELARAIGFDMVEAGWAPTVEAYLGRVTKAHILQAVTEAKGNQTAEAIAHLKKADMAREAERLMARTGRLPEPLRLAAVEADDPTAVTHETGTDETGKDIAESGAVSKPSFPDGELTEPLAREDKADVSDEIDEKAPIHPIAAE